MSELERRLRRIIVLVAILGIAGGSVGMVPGLHEYAEESVKAVAPVGGIAVWLFVGTTLLYAALLYYSPRRGVALAWVAWTAVGFMTAYGIAWNDHPLSGTYSSWAAPVMHTLLGAMILLIFPVTWIVAIKSRARPAADGAPSARIVTR